MSGPFYHPMTGYNSLYDTASEPLSLEEIKKILAEEMCDVTVIWILAQNIHTDDETKRLIVSYTTKDHGIILALARNPTLSHDMQKELLENQSLDSWHLTYGLSDNPNLDPRLMEDVIKRSDNDPTVIRKIQARFAETTKLGRIL